MTVYEPLKSYIDAFANMSGMATCGLLKHEGTFFTPQVLPRAYKRGVVRECYRNAYYLAYAHEELTYVEGLAMPDFMDIAIEHAWCVDEHGMVIDNTWPTVGAGYCGIAFELHFVCAVMVELNYFGTIQWHSKTFRDKYGYVCNMGGEHAVQV